MNRLELLDSARFAAALAVLGFHYSLNGIGNGKIQGVEINASLVEYFKYGYLGVEFFFIISGYVIYHSVKGKSAGEFVVSRLVRLFPAFWAGVIVTSIFAYLIGAAQMSVTPLQVIANLTMMPSVLGVPYVDGVYWTLELELAFYALVLVAIVLAPSLGLNALTHYWPIFLLMAYVLERWYWPFLGGYYCFFAAGCLFGLIGRGGFTMVNSALLGLVAFLCIQFSSGKAERLSAAKGVSYSESMIGILVASMFLFFLLINFKQLANLKVPGSKFMGAITYPLYLVHAHIGYMIITALSDHTPVWVAYLVAIVLVFTLALLIHFSVELKFSRQWRYLFGAMAGRPIDGIQKWFKAGFGVISK